MPIKRVARLRASGLVEPSTFDAPADVGDGTFSVAKAGEHFVVFFVSDRGVEGVVAVLGHGAHPV